MLLWQSDGLEEKALLPQYLVHGNDGPTSQTDFFVDSLLVKIIARLTYRQRYKQSTGRDPFRCPHCQGEREVWRIWHPTSGVIY